MARRAWPWTPIIIALWVASVAVAPFWVQFEQSRLYRDWVGITPFRSVQIEAATVRAGSIAVMGTLIKQRDCEIVGRSVWVRDSNGTLRAATFQSGPVPGLPPVKRYVSGDRQSFGPIIITPEGDFVPTGAVMFATHDCPDGRQSNVFFDVEWGDYP